MNDMIMIDSDSDIDSETSFLRELQHVAGDSRLEFLVSFKL
jgi:hypothetical protein